MNPSIKNYDLGSVLLGDNQFETGTLSLAQDDAVTNGTFLKRASNGKFEVVTDTDTETPVAVYIGDDLENKESSAKDFAIRAMIGGRIKAGVLNVAGTAATLAQRDMIRSYGIVAVEVTEVNQTDNQ